MKVKVRVRFAFCSLGFSFRVRVSVRVRVRHGRMYPNIALRPSPGQKASHRELVGKCRVGVGVRHE